MLEKILDALRKRKPATIEECQVCKSMIMPYADKPYFPPMSVRRLWYETYNIKKIDECSACPKDASNVT